MKTAISIPDKVFDSAEKLATRMGVSRSELYARAIASLVEKHREDVITTQLNLVYGTDANPSTLEPDIAGLQSHTLPRERW
ncbi:MAG: CopG family transcriptional regulator [Burkholderiales bacterium]